MNSDMPPIRVLIVDDSVVMRRQLSEVLATDPEIAVAGTAASGAVVLARIAELKPDLVTLDVEMPGMDGLQVLAEVRKLYPKLPVIMFSALTGPGAAAAVEALARGASDYATKPSHAGSLENSREQVRKELIPKIRALCGRRHPPGPSEHAIPVPAALPLGRTRIDVVAVGSSTGGPNALVELVTSLPEDLPVPVVVVQHMPAMFTRLLAERLDRMSRLAVREGVEGQKLEKGQIWIAPGDFHMTVVRRGADNVLALNQDAPENSCRPAVDVLFRSVAHVYGGNVLAVVLTGMGSDGTRGAAAIREAGGTIIVQDEASSVVWGMPGSIVAANLAERVCPLSALGPEIVRRVLSRRSVANAARV